MTTLAGPDSVGQRGMMSGSGQAGSLASVLPRLTQETELQKMLSEEKMRSEQHKMNYQTLKAKHTGLFDQYVALEKELKSTIEESRLVQEKYHGLLDQARKELATKHAECDQIRKQGPTDQQVELLRLKVEEDLEVGWRERLEYSNNEAETCRQHYNKLKYEHSFLQTEFQHERQENQRILEELKLRHNTEVRKLHQQLESCGDTSYMVDLKKALSSQAKVENLRREREAMLSRQSASEGGADVAQRLRNLQRENAQLQLKMKGVVAEMEELQAQREHSGVTSENVQRLQVKQIAEHNAITKALETERESLKLQVESMQRDLSSGIQSQSQLTGHIHDLEKENVVLRGKVDEVTHKSKVELTNLRMDMLKERGDLERERDRLANTIKDLDSQLDTLKMQVDQQADTMVTKEEDAERRIQAAGEQEWHKLTALESEKLEMEAKLQSIERSKIDEENRRASDLERQQEQLRSANNARESAEKEALVVKTKLQQQQSLLAQLEQTRVENASLASRLQRVETQYNNYVSSETELVDLNAELKDRAERLACELEKSQEAATRIGMQSDEVLASTRTSAANDRLNLQARLDDLESQLSDCHAKMNEMAELQKKKKRAASRIVSKLKNKLSVQHAQLQQLHLEREALRKSIPQETHLHLKKRLNDLVRRQRDFHTIMVASNFDSNPVGNLSMTGSLPKGGVTMPQYWNSLDLNQKDVADLKQRVTLLSNQQEQQMAELKGTIPPYKEPLFDDDDDLSDSPSISPRDHSNQTTPRDDQPLCTEDLGSDKE